MQKKIIIAGSSGFIGKYLTREFRKSGYEVLHISRSKDSIQWHDKEAMIEALENSTMLINLAGKSVNCRYTEKNKEAILKSRTETTRILGEAVSACSNPPEVWFNSSTATIYRHAEDRPMTESTGEIGTGFSIHVATSWEKEFFSFQLPRTRQIALRMAVVLGKEGGAMKPLVNLVRSGLGGKQGNGRQMFSWLHITDLFDIILFLYSRKDLQGVFNCSSPNPVDNKTLMKELRKAVGMPFGLPSPSWLLRIGAVMIGTETELVLKSRWVIPERLTAEGFNLSFPDLGNALKDILKLLTYCL